MKKYTKEHEWVETINDSEAYVGITEYAQSELGEIVFVDVQTEGETIGQMDVFGSIEAVKTVADLHMPISGEVVNFNNELDDHPEMINDDAEDKGWIIKINYNISKYITDL